MRAFFFSLLVIVISLNTNGAVITPFDSSKNVIEEGNIFDSRLSLEGNEDLNEADFAQINKEKFNDYLIPLEAQKLDGRDFKIRFLLKQFYQTGELTRARFGTKDIDLRMTGFHIKSAQNLPKDFIIKDQKENWGQFFSKISLYWVFGGIIFFSYPIFIILRKFYLKKKAAQEKKAKIQFWRKCFSESTDRQQFEEIGKRRKEWGLLLSEVPMEVEKFLSKLDEHQYKKELQDFELYELKQSLDGIKDVFDRYGI